MQVNTYAIFFWSCKIVLCPAKGLTFPCRNIPLATIGSSPDRYDIFGTRSSRVFSPSMKMFEICTKAWSFTWYPKQAVFVMDVWWKNHFLYKDLESSNWNNHLNRCFRFQVVILAPQTTTLLLRCAWLHRKNPIKKTSDEICTCQVRRKVKELECQVEANGMWWWWCLYVSIFAVRWCGGVWHFVVLWNELKWWNDTVDGRNPAAPGM